MAYERHLTRKQRIALEGNIPGSLGWSLEKNDGIYPEPTVSRNTMKKRCVARGHKGPNYHVEALNSGWTFHKDTHSWTHQSYGKKHFPSIYQTLHTDENGITTMTSVPFCNNEDPLGLAYNYTINGGGSIITITPNKWVSEEFDTRHGRRRELWRHKKELRKKYSLQFQAYKEQKREAERNGDEDYEREFKIQE